MLALAEGSEPSARQGNLALQCLIAPSSIVRQPSSTVDCTRGCCAGSDLSQASNAVHNSGLSSADSNSASQSKCFGCIFFTTLVPAARCVNLAVNDPYKVRDNTTGDDVR